MADRAGWRDAVESELRAAGRHLAVPPAGDVAAAVRQRLEAQRLTRPRLTAPRLTARRRERLALRRRRPGWRAALAVAAALLAVLIATPQGRAAIAHVFRFAGVELRLEPGPVRSWSAGPARPGGATQPSGAALPGEHRMSLEQARRQVSFPILVPAALGPPPEVVVSDGGRVVSLIYPRTRYGLLRMDEFAGRPDQIYFEKIVHIGDVTPVTVNGAKALWIKGPQVLVYIRPDGSPAAAPPRLTAGNTLLWSAPRVALRLEGNVGRAAALAIAGSAR